MLNLLQIILAIILIMIVVIQSQGGGLGNSFGNNTNYHTKRGAEKTIFFATIIFSSIFLIVAFFNSIS